MSEKVMGRRGRNLRAGPPRPKTLAGVCCNPVGEARAAAVAGTIAHRNGANRSLQLHFQAVPKFAGLWYTAGSGFWLASTDSVKHKDRHYA